ncbi:MAG TPA: hypothetical protein VFT90_11655 [Chryseosolibacter sp.]|nr:hypothetical protein [Chryseosolibacter sp.]
MIFDDMGGGADVDRFSFFCDSIFFRVSFMTCISFSPKAISYNLSKFFDHPETFFGALATNFRASFTILKFLRIALTFLRACVANHRAGMAQQRGKLTADAHQVGIRGTDNRALARKRYTSRKHFYIVFLKTFRCTMLTFGGASIARFDTIAEHISAENLVLHRHQLRLKISCSGPTSWW